MEEIETLCQCPKFRHWYTHNDTEGTDGLPRINVCECGHPETEHLEMTGSCIGTSLVQR